MTAKDYPVTSPYGATYSPWSPSRPHLGDDRAMPYRTPVVVNGVLIGYAGSTGISSGVHTHTQEVDDYQVVNPNGEGFDIPEPVIVFDEGYDADSIGNYVRLIDGDGVEWSWFHFDETKVKEGDVLEMYTDAKYKDIENGYSIYKEDVKAAKGGKVPAYFGWLAPTGWPKYKNWKRGDFQRQLSKGEHARADKAEEELENKGSEYEKVNEDLYRRK